MSQRVLIGEFAHESNTFADDLTTRAEFRERREYVGDEVVSELAGTNTELGGVVDVADREGTDLVPTVGASATPGGPVARDAYDHYTEHVVAAAREHADELDGVLLALHGAMVPEGIDDGEGPLVGRVRDVVGDCPIVVTHDLHGNVTDELLVAADALVAYETYPHVDMADTGRRAMELLLDAVRGTVDPVMAVERPPVVAYGPKQNTREGPMTDVMARARALEDRDGLLTVNVFPGFEAADVPSMGFSVPVVADGDPDAAREAAREVAEMVWERRETFVGDYPGAEEAVAEAAAKNGEADEGPVVLADAGDNPGGGGAADGTTVLRALLEQGVTDAGFAIMRDPEAVAACVGAGVGERVTVAIGGKSDDRHGDPIEDVDGYVAAITDGRFVNTGPMGTGTENRLGRTVRLQCGADDGVAVVLTENRMQPLDAEIWRHVGVQPERLAVLVVKSTNHFRADYEPMACRVIPVDSPGLAAMDPARYDHERIRRPQFPLDEMADDDYPDW
jgi:microcystin degradation protein MlrC